jgi:anti-sigma regulatory factor (Ser/Thr protein kinase)
MAATRRGDFRHDTIWYRGGDGGDDFVRCVAPFVDRALTDGAPLLAALKRANGEALRSALGVDAARVSVADIEAIGRNPARIIPLWHDFANAHAPRPVRGIGEPIWAGRSPAELDEAQRHEWLLNFAFADTPGMWIVCPYDVRALDPAVLDEARASHAMCSAEAGRGRGVSEAEFAAIAFGGTLPEPPVAVETIPFDADGLGEVRAAAGRIARMAGLDPSRASQFALSVDEAAANSIRHGGGSGIVSLWVDDPSASAEVRDRGVLRDPLTGRHRPSPHRPGGRGLWIANQLCDLVQLRSGPGGTTVRLSIRR